MRSMLRGILPRLTLVTGLLAVTVVAVADLIGPG
jgi:hypothetical protein